MTRSLRVRRLAAFWGTVGLVLALPLTYLPVWRGFPDVGAAALLGLATLLYLRDYELKSGWQRVALSLVIGLMPLFRRHFMYGLTAFLAAAILHHLILLLGKARQSPKEAFADSVKMAGRFLSIGFTIAVFWTIFAFLFVKVLLTNNYFSLYQAYMIPPLDVLSGFASTYGYILSITAVLGYVIGYRSGVFRSPGAQFVTLLGFLSVLQWMTIVRQQGLHYPNHFNIFILFGVLALVAATVKGLRGFPRYAVLTLLAALLIYRFGVCFAVLPAIDSPSPAGIVMAQNPPKIRKDFDEVIRLIALLRDKASGGANLFVASCSWMMNSDIIRNGEEDLYGKANIRLSVLQPPAVDSRDWLPVDMLLKSQYVLTVLPIQYSLSQKDEKLVSLVVDAFEQNLPLARDFEQMPETFALENGCTAKLYRRIRPSSLATALQELDREISLFVKLPGRQKPWISLDADQRCELPDTPNTPYRLVFKEDGYRPPHLSQERARHRLLTYIPPIPEGSRINCRVVLNGRWSSASIPIRCYWADSATGGRLTRPQSTTVRNGESLSLPIPPRPTKTIYPPLHAYRLLMEFVLPPESDANPLRDGQLILAQLQISG